MSGIKRAILAEVTRRGATGQEAMKALTPEQYRAETGRTVHSPAGKKQDQGEYLGKNAKDAKP